MGLSASDALPFESLPLRYEYAFGGTTASGQEAHNPVGRGFLRQREEGTGKAPTLPPPCGFGPVARHWQPRRDWAGTYDAAWVERRAPLWPRDFDERFFHAASDGLRASTHLQGGERVVLEGLSPDGPLAFNLPTHRLLARCTFAGRREKRHMVLDTVLLEPEER